MSLELFLKILIDNLDTENIKYCILRNYETLPTILKHGDIDFLILEEHTAKIAKIIQSIDDIYIVGVTKREYVHNYFIYNIDKGGESRAIQIDFVFKFLYKGTSYLDVEYLVSNRRFIKNKEFYIPSKFDEIFLMFFPFYLATGTLNKKYENIIISVLREEIDTFNEYFINLGFDISLIDKFYKSILNKDFLTLKKLSYDIRNKVFLYHFNTLNIFSHYNKELKLRIPFNNSYIVKVELNSENMKELCLVLDSYAKNIIFIDLNNSFDYFKLFKIQTNFTMYIFYKINSSMIIENTLKQIISNILLKKGLS